MLMSANYILLYATLLTLMTVVFLFVCFCMCLFTICHSIFEEMEIVWFQVRVIAKSDMASPNCIMGFQHLWCFGSNRLFRLRVNFIPRSFWPHHFSSFQMAGWCHLFWWILSACIIFQHIFSFETYFIIQNKPMFYIYFFCFVTAIFLGFTVLVH